MLVAWVFLLLLHEIVAWLMGGELLGARDWLWCVILMVVFYVQDASDQRFARRLRVLEVLFVEQIRKKKKE